MAAKTKARKTKIVRTAKKKKRADPWSDVGDHGSHLHIGHFLTFQLIRLANAAKSNVTRRYLADFGLSVPEWRLLAMTIRFQPVRFSELVANSSMDKGQASRTLHGMIKRGYIASKSTAPGSRRAGDTAAVPVILTVARKGRSLYRAVLPVAQRNQARLLQKLTRDERRTLYSVLSKLFSVIGMQERGDV
ncbi:MAG TPA: MarR family winged helix-turn-helix transcriptional regulator [Steroidobacteraceae bacterium]